MGHDDPVARLIARLSAEGLQPGSWANGPGDVYAAHAHGYDKVLACAAGSIEFGLPGRGEKVALRAGDRLDLPAGTVHDATVGPAGVTCLEAHLPAGTLPPVPVRRPADVW
jgi:quercetin dioxygenase-like cupin family protein